MKLQKVDFIVHVPLEEEWNEIRRVFELGENLTVANNPVFQLELPEGLSGIAVLQTGMGRSAAQEAVRHVLDRFSCSVYICLGIAGAIAKDLNLGDVCYSGQVIDIYDNSKVKDKGDGVDLSYSPDYYETPQNISLALNFVRTFPELSSNHDAWLRAARENAEATCPAAVPGRGDASELVREPKSIDGTLICGAVSESAEYGEQLKKIERKALAIETESGSIFSECKARGVPALTIRGISDYAVGKGKLEIDSESGVRSVAAYNAALFLKLQLENSHLIDRIRGEELDAAPRLEFPETQEHQENCLPALLEEIDKSVDESLRELSPAYRTKPAGYKLPMPRIKASDPELADARKEGPSEILDAMRLHRRLLVQVPRTYPDPALAYSIAQGLLLSEMDGKKLVPIVVDGRNVRPPNKAIRSEAFLDLPSGIERDGGELVFIIDSPSLSSDTRLKYLINQVRAEGESRIIIVTRDEKHLIQEADILRSTSARMYDLCGVSFLEMATFLENSFKLPSAEAEVLALQLRSTFSNFSLPAHPSFFAGIPSETLASLLQANRRSELIQLAVDGFLTFVVASDAEKVRLSRTRRAKFLRGLVVEMEVEKRSFSETDLVAMAEKMSAEYEYDLQSFSFIHDFVENGIIHFESGKAFITLPFIRSYLLALELSENPDLARRYFNLEDLDFDLLAFDLYCEIGAAAEIKELLSKRLTALLDGHNGVVMPHVLLSHSINPRIVGRPASLKVLASKISAARRAIENDENDRANKVQILEIVDRVNETVADTRSQEDDSDGPSAQAVSASELDRLVPLWLLASVLLGSAAEELKADERRELASLVVRASDRLLHLWTEFAASYDYTDVKRELLSDTKFREELEISEAELDSLLDMLVDLMEYTFLTEPIDRVLDHICEQKDPIIGNSLESANPGEATGPLLKAVWLSSIDHRKGKPLLDQAIKETPEFRFYRQTLASFLIRRVKWKISHKPTRLLLLDAAESLLKPMQPLLDKGQIKRLVENDPQSSGDST